MESNIEFQKRKMIIDELYAAKLITGDEWYKALAKLLDLYDLEIEINSE
jgi:hypothetical protein